MTAMVPLFPPPMMTRPWLSNETVRFVGEPMVAIVTEHAYQGEDAAEAVAVDYAPLPVVVDMETALSGDDRLYPELGTNVAVDFVAFQMMKGVTDDTFFEGCDVVVRQRVINNRVAACPLEGRAAAASWDGDSLTYWMSNQSPHSIWGTLQKTYGLEPTTLPGDRARRRWRLRPQDGGHARGDPRALVGPAARPAGASSSRPAPRT